MAESSRFWNTNDVGDGATAGFGKSLIAAWIQKIFARGGSGVLRGVGSDLAVSGSSSPLAVAAGAALVDGLYYENTAALNLTVTTPVVGTTGGRVILRANHSAQTVRAAILLSADGTADLPALTQTPGTTYEISLASFTITTGGTITLTDTRTWTIFSNSWRAEHLLLAGLAVLGNSAGSSGAGEAITASSDGQVLRRSGSALGFGQIATAGIADDAITVDKIADDAVGADQISALVSIITAQFADDAVDDTKLGDRVPQFYRRQGGSASSWITPGASDYTPGAVRMQGGARQVSVASGQLSGSVTITFPVAFSAAPLIIVSCSHTNSCQVMPGFSDVSASGFKCRLVATDINGPVVEFNWLAIGPQ